MRSPFKASKQFLGGERINVEILWKEAEILQQSKLIAYSSNYTAKYFSLYTPLEKICTLQMSKEVHSNLNVDKNVKSVIEENIKTQKFYIEGIGDVRHSENILDILVKDIVKNILILAFIKAITVSL